MATRQRTSRKEAAGYRTMPAADVRVSRRTRVLDTPPSEADGKGTAAVNAGNRRVDPELRRQRIATAAYYRAERRSFAGNRELEDWLEAEKEIDESATGHESRPDVAAPDGGRSDR
jgi:DUF2934 family protein